MALASCDPLRVCHLNHRNSHKSSALLYRLADTRIPPLTRNNFVPSAVARVVSVLSEAEHRCLPKNSRKIPIRWNFPRVTTFPRTPSAYLVVAIRHLTGPRYKRSKGSVLAENCVYRLWRHQKFSVNCQFPKKDQTHGAPGAPEGLWEVALPFSIQGWAARHPQPHRTHSLKTAQPRFRIFSSSPVKMNPFMHIASGN